MTAITLSQAQEMLTLYIEAEKKVLAGQSVSHSGRTLTRANLEEIKAGRIEWQGIVDQLTAAAAGDTTRRVRFMDWYPS